MTKYKTVFVIVILSSIYVATLTIFRLNEWYYLHNQIRFVKFSTSYRWMSVNRGSTKKINIKCYYFISQLASYNICVITDSHHAKLVVHYRVTFMRSIPTGITDSCEYTW